MGGEREVCTNRCVIVGSLWAEKERERDREREREGERERQREGEGRGTQTDREGEGEEEEGGEGGRVLWALGGNPCSAFEGWGSYNHPFVTSGEK